MTVVSTQPQGEPTIAAVMHMQEHTFMVNTGAIYFCTGSACSTFPLSCSSVKTAGFSGKTQVIPLTQLVSMLTAGRSLVTPPLYSENTLINLLKQDILCPMKANIMCTQNGLTNNYKS